MKTEFGRVLSQISNNTIISKEEQKQKNSRMSAATCLPETLKQNNKASLEQQRPALEALNYLNEQLEYQNEHSKLVDRIEELEQENRRLNKTVESLSKQLEVEKKLRKYVEKQNPKYCMMDKKELEQISNKVKILKLKYNR